MKLLHTLSLAVWLGLVLAVAARDVRNLNALEVQDVEERTMEEKEAEDSEQEERGLEISQPKERELISRTKLDSYMGKHDQTADLMNLGKTALESIGTFAAIDYSQSAEDIAWAVAGAVVPIISAALALIPGVGVLLSGLFSGLWGVISSIFAPKQENPMEKMIKQLEEKMNKRLDDKLSNVINLAIHGEISRNVYICNKYNYTYQAFAGKFKAKKPLEPLEATNLKIYLNDCDNFLKDTAEAFVYDEYAEILWVPGAITTSVRLGFLAELIKNGKLMGLTDEVLTMYYKELKMDTKRQFEYYAKGLKNLNDRHKEKKKFDPKTDYLKNITVVEMASCTLQSQLLYFDRSVYPYGMPSTILTNKDLFSNIKRSDYYNEDDFKSTQVKHLQIIFNATEAKFNSLPVRTPDNPNVNYMSKSPYFNLEFMNCFLGSMFQRAPSTFWFNFELMPGKGYSYEFRVLYLEKEINNTKAVTYDGKTYVPILHTLTKGQYKFNEYAAVQKKVDRNVDLNGKTCLGIYFQDIKSWSSEKYGTQLADVFGWAPWKKCPYAKIPRDCFRGFCTFQNFDIETCENFVSKFQGKFKIYSAGIFNHGDENVNSLIGIGDPITEYMAAGNGNKRYDISNGFLVGLEIIIRPTIPDEWGK